MINLKSFETSSTSLSLLTNHELQTGLNITQHRKGIVFLTQITGVLLERFMELVYPILGQGVTTRGTVVTGQPQNTLLPNILHV